MKLTSNKDKENMWFFKRSLLLSAIILGLLTVILISVSGGQFSNLFAVF
jgi:hypothetical protein